MGQCCAQRGKIRDFLTCDLPGCYQCMVDVIRSLRSTVDHKNAQLDSLRSEMKELKRRQTFLCMVDGDVMFEDYPWMEPLYAHKAVLAGKSPVFRKMFETRGLGKETVIIEVEDASFEVMRAVIKFCYDAEIIFDGKMVRCEDVLEVAHKYGIELLFKICEEHLIKTIDMGNLPRRLKLAKKVGAEGLQTEAFKYFKSNFDEVIVSVMDEAFRPCYCIMEKPSYPDRPSSPEKNEERCYGKGYGDMDWPSSPESPE